MNPETLSEMLGRPVSDAVVLVAKNLVLGGSPESVAQILGVQDSEVQEIMESQDYKDVYLLMAAQYNSDAIRRDLSYDEIESEALAKLMKALDRDPGKDIDKLIRVATMANRAVRRQTMAQHDGILDPGSANGQVRLTLTKRIIDRLNMTGEHSRQITEQISIHAGSTKPTFEEISKFFDPRMDSQDARLIANQTDEITPESIAHLLDDNR